MSRGDTYFILGCYSMGDPQQTLWGSSPPIAADVSSTFSNQNGATTPMAMLPQLGDGIRTYWNGIPAFSGGYPTLPETKNDFSVYHPNFSANDRNGIPDGIPDIL